jgi:hypothetical protein
MRRTAAALVVLCAGLLGAAVVGASGPASAQIPDLPGGTGTTETSPPPETQTEPPPPPPPPPPERRETTITLEVDKTDVASGDRVVFSGRVDPVPENARDELVEIGSEIPGVRYSDESAGQARLEPDGTFRITYRPRINRRYAAIVYVGSRSVVSPPVVVYADYIPRVRWRRLPGSRFEALMLLSVTAEVIDSFSGHLLSFYGFRSMRSRTARRLARTRMVYTGNYSTSRAAAYVKRRVRGLRRIRYVFACVHEKRPDKFGRPDDPIQRQCGRRIMRAPAD